MFNGHIWKSFPKECGVHRHKITLLWPQANVQAECFIKPLMKAMKAVSINGLTLHTEMQRMLRAYRSKPHVTTAFSPHRLMARDSRSNLPEVVQGPPKATRSLMPTRRQGLLDRNWRCRVRTSAQDREIVDTVSSQAVGHHQPKGLHGDGTSSRWVTRDAKHVHVSQTATRSSRRPSSDRRQGCRGRDRDGCTPRDTNSWTRPRKGDTASNGHRIKKIGRTSQKTYTASAGTSVRRHVTMELYFVFQD